MFAAGFLPFIEKRPIGVMARAITERFFEPEHLDVLFRETAVHQYQRNLLFSSVVDLMQGVVLGYDPSVFAAYTKRQKTFPVSDQALYDKLNRMELGVSAALVRDSARRAAEAIEALGARRPAWLPGYRVRILDGNAPAATEHRLEPLRDIWAAPLPGKILVVMDPELSLACDAFLTPDGHAQERSLLDEVLQTVCQRDLWMADRNFCTQKFLFEIEKKLAFFLIRQHGTLQGHLQGKRSFSGDSSTGKVYEQSLELTYAGQTRTVRHITIELLKPTRDGDTLQGLPDDLIESRHAARIAQCNLQTIYRWILNNSLRGWKRCGRTFVSRADLMALFEPMQTQKEKAVNDIPCRRDIKRMERWTHDELLRRGVIQS